MKATKKIVGAACALVAAVALSAGSTFAWFSSNSVVNANGMDVTISQKSPFLVISKESNTSDADATEISFADPTAVTRTEMLPCTHGEIDETFTTGLKYVSNPGSIDKETGLQATGADALTYSDVTVAADSKYYIDYVVYIAAYDVMASQDLKVTLTHSIANPSVAQKACSVDFYVGEVGTANYKGTLNIAGVKPTDITQEQKTLTLYTGDIPVRTGTPISVTMRVYFDGALKQSDTAAYIATTTITSAAVQTVLGAEFTATAHVA